MEAGGEIPGGGTGSTRSFHRACCSRAPFLTPPSYLVLARARVCVCVWVGGSHAGLGVVVKGEGWEYGSHLEQ